MSPIWDPSRTVGAAVRIAGDLVKKGYRSEASYVFREAVVVLAGTSALPAALKWWADLSSRVTSGQDAEVGTRLRGVSRELQAAGYASESIRVLAVAVRHAPAPDIDPE